MHTSPSRGRSPRNRSDFFLILGPGLLLFCLSGCAGWTSPEYVPINASDPVISALLEKYDGSLEAIRAVSEDYEALKAAISEQREGARVLDVGEFSDHLAGRLEPILVHAGKEGISEAAETLKKDPSWGGLLNALLAGLLAAGGVIGVRAGKNKLAAKKASTKKGAAK